MIERVIKKDGREEAFDIRKIATSISKAAKDAKDNAIDVAGGLAKQVLDELITKASGAAVTKTSDIKSAVENVLTRNGFGRAARLFIGFIKHVL